MNKPTPNLQPSDDDLGPLDERGQQIWSPETEAAIARLHADPEYWAGIEEALEDVSGGAGLYDRRSLGASSRNQATLAG